MVFETILTGKDNRAVVELQEAYHLFFGTVGGPKKLFEGSFDAPTWSMAQKKYDKKLDNIETRIKEIIDKRLKGARSAEEMFRIFSDFNSLFFRPSIRNAVTAYQSELMSCVRQDVKRLQDKFRCRYDDSAERTTAIVHDVPPLSGKILWAKQIEHQLSAVIQKIRECSGKKLGRIIAKGSS
jgi:dynein heavy chain 1, cytosolic